MVLRSRNRCTSNTSQESIAKGAYFGRSNMSSAQRKQVCRAARNRLRKDEGVCDTPPIQLADNSTGAHKSRKGRSMQAGGKGMLESEAGRAIPRIPHR